MDKWVSVLQTQCNSSFFFLYIDKHFYNHFFPALYIFVLFYRVEGLYKTMKRRMLGGKSQYIVRAAYEVQSSPADIINVTTDQELLQQLVHLVEEQVFIVGREMYNSLVWNRSNK